MPKPEFMSLITLQAAEGQQEACLELLKKTFDDPSVLEMQFYHSEEDPEILMSLQKWPSLGTFEEYMRKVHDNELFMNSKNVVEFVQITRWTPLG